MQDAVITLAQTVGVSTAAYAAGDLVGGKLTFPLGALDNTRGAVIVDRVMIHDKIAQSASLDLILMTDDISTQTTLTDNSAFAPAAVDLAKVSNVLRVTSYSTFSANSVGFVAVDEAVRVNKTADSPALYGYLVAVGTPTFTSTSDLVVNLTIRAPGQG